jgi:CubicO group peptidase (beta-lactamase class C family)
MSADDIFEIFSITKPFTSVVVMMLIEEGLLGLDQPVSDILSLLAKPEIITGFEENTGAHDTRPVGA